MLSLAPWNKHDLGIRAFADRFGQLLGEAFSHLCLTVSLPPPRLHDLGHLVYLYSNKPKDEVFGKYYTLPPRECLPTAALGQHCHQKSRLFPPQLKCRAMMAMCSQP